MTSSLFSGFCRRAFLATALTICGNAAVLLDTGYIPFVADGIQFDRIARDGNSSTWGSDKAFPGTLGDSRARGYELFTVDSGPYQFLQISLDDPFARLFVAAFLNSFNPVNSPPSFGLDDNYLGDPGLTQPFGNPSFFQIQVAPNSLIALPVNEITPGGGAGSPFNLIVEGFVDADYGELPEPAPVWLFGAGVVVLVVLRARSFTGAVRPQF